MFGKHQSIFSHYKQANLTNYMIENLLLHYRVFLYYSRQKQKMLFLKLTISMIKQVRALWVLPTGYSMVKIQL